MLFKEHLLITRATPIKIGLVFFEDGRKFKYRTIPSASAMICGSHTPLSLLYIRLNKISTVSEKILLAPDTEPYLPLISEATALNMQIETFSNNQIVEKPFTHSEERWQIFRDRGHDTWLGSAFAKIVEKYCLDHLILVSLRNLFIDSPGIADSLKLHLREKFDVTFSEDRLPGANWAIFSGELLRGLQVSHPDIMKVRGGLSWLLRKPVYPFRIGYFHAPRSRSAINCDLSLTSTRPLRCISETCDLSSLETEFSFKAWISNSKWLEAFVDQGPLAVVVELTNNCNGRCFACPQPLLKRNREFIKSEIFHRLFNDLSKIEDCRWIFSGMGEPLLHPEFAEFCNLLRHRHLMLITSLAVTPIPSVPWSSIDLIRISFDANDENLFKTVKPGCSWETMQSFLKERNLAKTKEPEKEPEIGVSFLRHKLNAASATEFITRWRKISFPAFRTEFFLWPLNTPPDLVQWYQIIGLSDFLGKIPFEYSIRYTPMNRKICLHALTRMHVLCDGKVVICPYDVDGKYVLGQIQNTNPMEIWQSKKAREFRQMHIQQAFTDEYPCKECKDWYHQE